MPEGPEIRLAADKLQAVLQDKPVTVSFGLPKLAHYDELLSGERIIALETRGKALLTHFEHGYSIYSHNQLYGVWKVVKGHALPASSRSLRLLLQTDSHSAILYSASDISVWPTAELAMHPFLARVGPDILNPSLHWRDIAALLQSARFRRRELASLYLDQHFLAGIGNYLRSEILFIAQLQPKLKPSQLSRAQVGQLARATLTVSQRSYATRGITLAPNLAKRLKREAGPRERRRFYVFSRDGLPCYVCGTEIQRLELNGRRLYCCPHCQADV
ncbi:MAG: endonuclease VIII [Pseudomonadales bacterium]|nr:endonuclease VIII [Pseudomonadales bacterium]